MSDVEKRKWVSSEDIAEVRAGLHATFPWTSSRCAWCVSCRGKLTGLRLGVVIHGVMGSHYLHTDPRECEAVISQRRAAAKPIVVKVPKPYVPKVAGWTLSPDEFAAAEFVKDNRLPRRVTSCRLCGQEIVAGQDRSAFKVKDERGWTSRQGFVHTICEGRQSSATGGARESVFKNIA